MLFITGDTHGDFRRFNTEIFPEQKSMIKQDYVIVCGDFGIWNDSKQERHWLDWLNDKPFTTLFVTGNHSNYDRLKQMPIHDWNGGKVQFIRDSVIHLMRGQVYEFAGKRFFTMGGASSYDIDDGMLEPDDPEFRRKRTRLDARGAMYRVNHLSWWKEELPDDEEYEMARRNLDACGWKVNYVVSHCCPTNIANMLLKGIYKADRLTDFFQEISERCDFRYWFFGHYHGNQTIMGKYILLYEQILEID